jgi:hypothetical protein
LLLPLYTTVFLTKLQCNPLLCGIPPLIKTLTSALNYKSGKSLKTAKRMTSGCKASNICKCVNYMVDFRGEEQIFGRICGS